MCTSWRISRDTLRHVWEKHGDLVKELKLKNFEELLGVIVQVLEQPDEVYIDKLQEQRQVLPAEARQTLGKRGSGECHCEDRILN